LKHLKYFSDKRLNLSVTIGGDLKIQGLSSLQDDLRIQVLQYAQENKWRIIFEIQTQDKTIQQQFDSLWETAETLADLIDNPESDVPLQERAAKVPALQEMSAELDRLKSIINVEKKNKPAPKHRAENRLNSLEYFSPLPKLPEPKKYHQDSCPARCNQSGKCYGIAYFDAKPGKALLCTPDKCLWSDQMKLNFNEKEN